MTRAVDVVRIKDGASRPGKPVAAQILGDCLGGRVIDNWRDDVSAGVKVCGTSCGAAAVVRATSATSCASRLRASTPEQH